MEKNRCCRCTFACPSHYLLPASWFVQCTLAAEIAELWKRHSSSAMTAHASSVVLRHSSTCLRTRFHTSVPSPQLQCPSISNKLSQSSRLPTMRQLHQNNSLLSSQSSRSVITPVLSRDIPANKFITARASPIRLIFCSSFCRPPGSYCRSIHT